MPVGSSTWQWRRTAAVDARAGKTDRLLYITAVSTRPVTGPREKITATFDGGTLSSNGGVLILREIEKRLGLATGSASTFLTIAMAGVQAQLQRHDAGADVRDCQWP